MDTKRRHQDLIERYERGEDVDISDLSQPTIDRLQSERAKREEMTRRYEAGQAKQGEFREAELRTRFLANGGTTAQWEREKAAILAEDRRRRTLDGRAPGMFDHIRREAGIY